MRVSTILRVAATSILVPWLIAVAMLALLGLTFTSAGTRPDTPPTSVHYAIIGDYGYWQNPAEASVSTLVHGWNPDFIITTGDNNYDLGSASTIDPNIGQYYHDFIYPYMGSYGQGAPYNKFFPSLGNHDWETTGATPYLNYFTLPGNERYYQFVQGPVHFFAIDSDGREPDGNTSTSVQAAWLQNQLAEATEPWKLVYFHHPPYSSGSSHGSTPALQWPFQQWGTSVVLTGHEHNYERLLVNGFPYIVNGLGGRSIYGFGTPLPQSVVRYSADYGAMLVDATAMTMTFQFIARTGVVIDTYTMTAPLTPTATLTATRTPTATYTPTATHTPTPVPTATATATDTPVSLLVGHVNWQGRPAQPDVLQQLPITLTLKLGATEVNYPGQTTDASGTFTVSVGGLPPGTYNWRAKGPQFLANAGTVPLSLEGWKVTRLERSPSNFVTFQPSNLLTISLEMGLMLTGDCDNNNVVNVADFNILKNSFGRVPGDPDYDSRADLNGDDTVNILDYGLQKSNFAQSGAPPIRPSR